jgi:hypothetical protein
MWNLKNWAMAFCQAQWSYPLSQKFELNRGMFTMNISFTQTKKLSQLDRDSFIARHGFRTDGVDSLNELVQ